VALADYTSYDEVRVVLGISSDELTDAQLDLDIVGQSLLMELLSISAALPAGYATVLAIAEAARTAAETNLYVAVKVFAPYAAARPLLPGLPLLAPKDITDGKAGVTRFSSQPYAETIRQVNAGFDRARAVLVQAFGAYSSSSVVATARPYMSVVAPASDPVTGT